MKKIAIQGFQGSFHDIAAHKYHKGEEIELVYCGSFDEVFDRVKEDPQMSAFVACENTIAGSLLHNYELICNSSLTIEGEYKLHIEHSLLCLPDETLDNIKEINSHPVALMQCRKFLSQQLHCKAVEADDTAGAAAQIAKEHLKGHAAICHADVAKIFPLKVIQEGIEDNKHNYTRFLHLVHHKKEFTPQIADRINKASIVFSLSHEEGALMKVLAVFHCYNINLTKIQSLPIQGKEWEYLFYIDMTFSELATFRQALRAAQPLTKEWKLLGEYPQA